MKIFGIPHGARTIVSVRDVLRDYLRPRTLVDLTARDIHPIHAEYLHYYDEFVANIPVRNLRAFGALAFRCTPEDGHPFVDTLIDYEAGRCREYDGSVLQRYYRMVQPKSAADIFGLPDKGLSERLAGLTALQAIAPWWPDTEELSPARIEAHRRKRALEENREHGADFGIDDGMSLWGPVSDRKGRLEYGRLVATYKSVRDTGYRRSDLRNGDIIGTLFVGPGENYVVNISAGQHRAAVLAALGHEMVPVRFSRSFHARIVRRDDAENWPFVRNGLFTADQARQVFDRVLKGRDAGAVIEVAAGAGDARALAPLDQSA